MELAAGERHLGGREIYRNLCAKCHGRDGEGVKDKHDGPLQGDRSLEKLTHYIERKMPEDKPGTCVGQDANAVARYIYDGFYSREARLRKNPPRVELAHLTNRQYLNSIADLLKHFTGYDTANKIEHGLLGTYHNARDFNEDKKLFERIDPRVDFDFNVGSDHEKLAGTNGFSIQWRGSLVAEETGDYEFVVKSPNGVRLWVNDNKEPLVDGWVASGQVSEHKATTRLIGGRAYPLRLNLFKFKEKSGSVLLQWKPPRGSEETIPPRSLLTSATSPTFVVTTPFPPDDSSLGYERGMLVSKAWDEATTSAAIEVANYVVEHLDQLSHSKQDETNRITKLEAFCMELVTTAWRKPLTQQQSNLVVSAQFKSTSKTDDAVKRVVLLALKSPRFLYRGLQMSASAVTRSSASLNRRAESKAPAKGAQTKTQSSRAEGAWPEDFEIASRLSFSLWDSLPDQELWSRALKHELQSRERVREQAHRMLADPRAHAKMRGFFHHWLQMDRVENLSKDDKLFPGFTAGVIADLRTSLDLFLDEVLWSDASDYRELLRADYLYLNNRLAEFYGVGTNAVDDFVKVKPNTEQRSGVLTHPYLLAAFSYQKLTSPIHRGVFLTRNIVGRGLRPPPMAMTFKDADFAPNLTMREKVSQLTRPDACQGCHSVINPLGFSLEQFDAVGRFRTMENDQPINPVSDYLTDENQTVHLAGARDVANYAISSEEAQDAFIEQFFHHLIQQGCLAYGADTLKRLQQCFVGSDYNMKKLIQEIVVTAAMGSIDNPEETLSRISK